MSRTTVSRLTAGALFLFVAWFGYTQNNAPPKLTLNKVTDDLYEIEGDGGNVAVYITPEGIILVDDKYERDHEQIAAHIKSISDKPVKYILTTHYHEDHSGGNAKYMGTAEVVSTVNTRNNILKKAQVNVVINPQPARVAFENETSILLGGKEVRARYFGRGHTNGDAVVYFPALKTIHTGDLMSGQNPLIDYSGGGSLAEWAKTLDGAMAGWDFDRVIPGHGPITNKAGLKAYRDHVDKIRARAQELVRAGKGRAELAQAMTAEFGWAANGLQIEWSVPGMLTELK